MAGWRWAGPADAGPMRTDAELVVLLVRPHEQGGGHGSGRRRLDAGEARRRP